MRSYLIAHICLFLQTSTFFIATMAHVWREMDTMQIQIAQDAYKCSICDDISTSPTQLTVHCIVLHELLPCMHCLKLFGTKQLLNDHMHNQHAQRTYSCSECREVFTAEKDLCFHMTRIHFKKQCALCVANVMYDDFRSHLEKLHKITNTAAVAAAIAAKQIISFEKVLEQRPQFHCHLCQDKKCMNRLEKLISHFLYFHKLSLSSLVRCFFVADSTSYSIQLMNTADGDDDDSRFANKCDRCDLAYSWSIPRIFHRIYCHGSVYCAICRNYFENHQIFDEHLKHVHCHNGEQLPAIKLCDIDDDEYDMCNIANVTHLKTVHKFSENYECRNAEVSLIKNQHECNFCGESLQNNSSRPLSLDCFIKHFRLAHRINADAILRCLSEQIDGIKVNTGEQCLSSGKRSIENSSVEQFILVEHELDESRIEHRMDFAANIVRYVYSSESDYESTDSDDNSHTIHSRTVADRIYRCELCGCRSKSKYNFLMHMHQTHGLQLNTPQFRCNVCRKHLKSAHFLKKHNRTVHHKSNANSDTGGKCHEKRYKCAFCAFGCNGKSKMR